MTTTFQKNILFIAILFLSITGFSQYQWQWTQRADMPMQTANNAVCEAVVNNQKYMYSFGGIDATKLYSGIHQRSFKYDVAADQWTEIAPLPDTLGKIAMGASYVKGKIYILGGYHVFANQNEISSDRVHVYNPQTETYEADGASIPRAIDDHVQAVWRDSLIYVITGWSNTTNYPDVQIYNPSLDQWQSGTSVPNTNFYKAFGASGYIIGDTIYYHGGVTAGFNFVAQSYVRKGVIDANDPTQITWSQLPNAPGLKGYRSACGGAGNTVFWVGGAGVAYNYNGIAYSGGGVEPSTRILHYNQGTDQYYDNTSEPIGIMDLRGIARLSDSQWMICGGMDSSQVVSNRTFLLENVVAVELDEIKEQLTYEIDANGLIIYSLKNERAELIDVDGKIINEFPPNIIFSIPSEQLKKGYLFRQGQATLRLPVPID